MNYRVVKLEAPDKPGEAKSILIIYTGGTLGMTHDDHGTLRPFNFGKIVDELPALKKLGLNLTVISFPEPLDSSNMQIDHWNDLADIIADQYEHYDGFVILHGTDTMAYSASALSFMLEGQRKPVIFTGAQLPMSATRTDAGQNLIAALQIASAQSESGPIVKEVCIYFDYMLLRGNRCQKVESVHFDAFKSENYPALAEAGISIDFNYPWLHQPQSQVDFKVHHIKPCSIALLKLFPGMDYQLVEHQLKAPGLQAVLLETFGSGNAPTHRPFIKALSEAIEGGIVVYNVSQCNGGRVLQGRYSTSKRLQEMGVVSGADITTEAALAKLQFLLSKELNYPQIVSELSTSIRGEMA